MSYLSVYLMKIKTIVVWMFLVVSRKAYGQFTNSSTGLLHMLTADMQRDKTFMFGGSFLEKHATPPHWSYNTYNYYLRVLF